jgi:hypothetical protein
VATRVAIETTRLGDAPRDVSSATDLAARLGVGARREALTAGVSITASSGFDLPSPVLPAEQITGRASIPWVSEAWVGLSPEISEALTVDVVVGRQPVQFHEGRILGLDDRRLRGDYLDAARLRLGAAPWSLDLVAGADLESGDDLGDVMVPANAGAVEFSGYNAQPVFFARGGAGRENAAAAWTADLVYAGTTDPEHGERQTVGIYGQASVGRLRARIDGYIQPNPLASAYLTGGRLGWAFGDDARVVMGAFVEAQSPDGGGTLAFVRPWATRGEDFGYLGLVEPGGALEWLGVLDAGALVDARVTPGVRVEGRAHLLQTYDGSADIVEIDADLHWWLTPLCALRFRGGVGAPVADVTAVRSVSALSLDLAL